MNKIKNWYVVRVNWHQENKVHNLLQEMSIDSFLPMTTTIRQWSDRKKKIRKPLFPSYLFLKISSNKDFHRALSVKGVIKFLQFAGEYARVRECEIRVIKQLLNLEKVSDINTINEMPKIGKKMKIVFGPLSGLECIVTKTNNKNKIFVRIDSMQQNIIATVPINYLTPLLDKVL